MNSDMENGKAGAKQMQPMAKKSKSTAETFDFAEIERMLPENLDDLYKTFPLTEETTCGLWMFRGEFLQKLANKKVYVFLYGVIGCVFSATYAYFNGIITTLEKRYHITSQKSGTISVGNDISQLLVSAVLSYYAGKGHRPRWMAFGLGTIVIFCLMNILPHFLYGPGEDALALTAEYGARYDANDTSGVLDRENRKTLCNTNGHASVECDDGDGNYTPQVILFVAQFISGIGQPLYYTLGVTYMDDNIQKSKTPTFISLAYFIRMLGPALGYTLASMCLKIYISPSLTPTIDNSDPRWLGAWWLGWFIFAILMFLIAILLAMFPKTLPRAAVRRVIQNEKNRRELSTVQPEVVKASIKDMFTTFKRLLRNTTFMLNNIASFFYIFGYMPYWTFTPKYIETQYRQSASVSSLVTGTVALVFSAVGILSSGFIISRFRPSARAMAAWNVIVGIFTVCGVISYIFLGCADNERAVVLNYPNHGDSLAACNAHCSCDFVKYTPICGENGNTYISGCHAGCTDRILNNDHLHKLFMHRTHETEQLNNTGRGRHWKTGRCMIMSCPVNCQDEFYAFLAVMCILKFLGASGRSSNFLVGVRCVEEHDKTVAMGFGLMLMGFAFIPSPIFFGMILDSTCLVWGKTCSGTGNCWLYDGETLRFLLNTISTGFIVISVMFDAGVWYYVKDLKIFDDDDNGADHLNLTPVNKQNNDSNSNVSVEKRPTQ